MLKKFGRMNVCRGTGRSLFSFYFEPCSWPFPLSIQSLPKFNFVCFYSLWNPCVSQILFLYTALLTEMTAHETTQLHIHLPLVSLNNKTRKTTIHMVQRHFRTALILCTLSSSKIITCCVSVVDGRIEWRFISMYEVNLSYTRAQNDRLKNS